MAVLDMFCRRKATAASEYASSQVHAAPPAKAPPGHAAKQTAKDALKQHKRFLQDHILPHHPGVELCSAAEYEACLRVWVESFAAPPQNPMFRWIVANGAISEAEQDARFREQLAYMLHFVNRVYKERGIFLAVRDAAGTIVAAASLLPPGADANPFTVANFAATGMPPVMRHRLSWGPVPCKKLDSLSVGDAAKAALRKEIGPCWYLLCLGVAPGLQGQGYGRMLLQALCAAADAQGLPAHLECETEWHERLYGRYGFKTAKYVDLTVKEDPEVAPQFLMMRPPAQEHAAK